MGAACCHTGRRGRSRIGKFLTDSIWWFYLFWFPKFMNEQFGVDIKTIGPPMITVFLLADVGSIWRRLAELAGSWRRGWSVNAARKNWRCSPARCASCRWSAGAAGVESEWVAVLLIGFAAAAHQGFSANLFTLASDMFPRYAVGSVVGIGGFAGAMGGLFMNLAAGRLKDLTGNYIAIFSVAAMAYLVALAVIHILAPRLEPVQLGETA